MITAIGIDIVDIERFKHFHLYKHQQLLRIFSPQEIDYCLLDGLKSAERFAVRFSAKEACYKALCQMHKKNIMSFLSFCQKIEIVKSPYPKIIARIHESMFGNLTVFVSISHSKTTAIAQVTLIKADKKFKKHAYIQKKQQKDLTKI